MSAPFLNLGLEINEIPIVQSVTDRETRFPVATRPTNLRVQNLGTGFVERWTGAVWLSPDPAFAPSSGGGGGGTSNPLAGQTGVVGSGFTTVVDTTAHRNALNNVTAFSVVFNLQTGNFGGWNGSAWVTFAEGIGNFGTQPPTGTLGSYATGRTSVPWFNVSTFGAIGNGINGDGPAIQAAISAATAQGGGVVFFPPGRYLGGTTVTLAPNVSFFAIRGSVTLVSSGGSIPYFLDGSAGGLGTIAFYGLMFEALVSPAGGMIALANLTGTTLVVQDCEFNTPQATGAISATTTGVNGRAWIDRCLIRSCGGAGIAFASGGVVTHCIVENTAGTGIIASVVRSSQVQFTAGSTQHGIQLVAAGGGPLGSGDSFGKVACVGNTVALNSAGTANGIIANGLSGDIEIAHNQVDSTGGSGIYCVNCTGAIVAVGNQTRQSNLNNNVSTAGAQGGIEFGACSIVTAVGNTYRQSGAHAVAGIYSTGGGQQVFAANVANGCEAVFDGSPSAGTEQVANVGGYNSFNPASGLTSQAGVQASVYQGLQLAVVGTGTLVGLTPQSSPALPQTVRATLTGAAATTLPTASTVVGAILYFKRLDANAGAWTLTANGGDTIDGAATKTCNGQFTVVRLQATATGWDVL